MALENKDNILQVFQTRARQLMYEYESVRKQRNELVKTVEQKETSREVGKPRAIISESQNGQDDRDKQWRRGQIKTAF